MEIFQKRPGPLSSRAILVALVLLLTGFYATTLDFGFFWDDPVWFEHAVDKSWLELIRPTTDYHFYRPGGLFFIHLFQSADGVYSAPALHWAQIGWHVLNVSLIYAIGRRLGLPFVAAILAAVMAALSPFSFQAVAWAAPLQPLASTLQLGAWLLYLVSRKRDTTGNSQYRWPVLFGLSLLLYFLALTVHESSFPLAVLPLLFEFARARRRPPALSPFSWLKPLLAPDWYRPLAYPLMAAIYLIYWLLAPRFEGVIGLALEPRVTAYLMQGLVYPLLGRFNGYGPGAETESGWVFLVSTAIILLLLAVARQGKLGRLALLGMLWAWLGLLPAQVGLNFAYVRLGSRLLYTAIPGVVILWICAICSLWKRVGLFWRWAAALGLILIIGQSAWFLERFNALYRVGVDHLAEAIGVMEADDGPYLFVNFPDQYREKRRPYPLGYWGLPLAPVRVAMADFPRIQSGVAVQTTSKAVPWIDTDMRADGPYEVDMRGVIVPADELYSLAATYPSIYLTRYTLAGEFRLERAGSIKTGAAGECRLAKYSEQICLQAVAVNQSGGKWEVTLSWSTETKLPPHVTIFTHLGPAGRPPLVQDDGDAWRGMLPLTMWQPGDIVVDERLLPVVAGEQPLELRIGIYDRLTGERLPARSAGGEPLPGDAYGLMLGP